MKLKFDLKDKKNINIINEKDGRIVGRIFTPSGTGRDRPNSIQICGFSELFDFWSCGVFFDKNKNPTKDVQLMFDEDSHFNPNAFSKYNMVKDCGRCFYPKDKCKCDEFKSDLRYEQVTKKRILKALE